MIAARELKLRHGIAHHDLSRGSIDAYIDRPMLRVARYLNPGFGSDLPALGKGSAVGVQRQRQSLRPRATKRFAIRCRGVRKKRALTEVLILENPEPPGLELAWHVYGSANGRHRGEHPQQGQGAMKRMT